MQNSAKVKELSQAYVAQHFPNYGMPSAVIEIFADGCNKGIELAMDEVLDFANYIALELMNRRIEKARIGKDKWLQVETGDLVSTRSLYKEFKNS